MSKSFVQPVADLAFQGRSVWFRSWLFALQVLVQGCGFRRLWEGIVVLKLFCCATLDFPVCGSRRFLPYALLFVPGSGQSRLQ